MNCPFLHSPPSLFYLHTQVRISLDGQEASCQELPYPSPPSGLSAIDAETWRQVRATLFFVCMGMSM